MFLIYNIRAEWLLWNYHIYTCLRGIIDCMELICTTCGLKCKVFHFMIHVPICHKSSCFLNCSKVLFMQILVPQSFKRILLTHVRVITKRPRWLRKCLIFIYALHLIFVISSVRYKPKNCLFRLKGFNSKYARTWTTGWIFPPNGFERILICLTFSIYHL